MLFWPILGHFWCPVVTSVSFSSNLSNFEKNPEKHKKSKKTIIKKIKFPKKIKIKIKINSTTTKKIVIKSKNPKKSLFF